MLETLLVGHVTCFVEIVHIELPDEAGKVAVLEIFGQDFVTEFIDALDYKAISFIIPTYYVIRFRITHNFICFHKEWGDIRMRICSSRWFLNSDSITTQQLRLLLVNVTATGPIAILALASQLPASFLFLNLFGTRCLFFLCFLYFISVRNLIIRCFLLAHDVLAVFPDLLVRSLKMMVAAIYWGGSRRICLPASLRFGLYDWCRTMHHLSRGFLGLGLLWIDWVWVIEVGRYVSYSFCQKSLVVVVVLWRHSYLLHFL